MYRKFLGIAVVAGVVAAGGTAAEAREQIRIVGSSTVYPFATVVAERFGKTTNLPRIYAVERSVANGTHGT